MKKLMFAAVAAAVTTGAFAAPLVYDYKSNVKHVNLKEIKLKTKDFNGVVYQKYQKSATLKGYLIMDDDGATSATYGGLCDNTGTYSADWGRNRGFLVVMNTKAESKVRAPKILPAVLDSKWIDTNFKKNHMASSGLAEGTLFVGGDTVAAVRPKIEKVSGVHSENATALTAPAACTPGAVALADYVWTSIYLFGEFNGPNWFTDPVTGLSVFDAFEAAWDANLPAGVQTGWANKTSVNYFHDTWMNGAGIGKYGVDRWTDVSGDLCCGLKPSFKDNENRYLQSLSGNLKGGIFLCTENGIDANAPEYYWFDGFAWEDQFVCCRDELHTLTYGADAWQNDLWQDGAVQQETTDVVFGTWSIKYNKSFLGKIARELTVAEEADILPAPGTLPLWACIKGAALKLKGTTTLYNGAEIYDAAPNARYAIPMITPKFAMYYGLK